MTDLQLFTDRIRRFARFRRHLLDAALAYRLGALALFGGVIAICLLSGWLPNAWVNVALFAGLALFWTGLLIVLCCRWSRQRPPLAEAFRMEELAGNLNSRIVSAWDFLARGPETPLTRTVIGWARDDLRVDFEARLDPAERNRRRRQFLSILLLFMVLGLTPWFAFAAVAANLSRSWRTVREALFPVQFSMEPEPGTYVFLLDQKATLRIHFPDREYQSVKLVRQTGETSEDLDLPVDETGRATHQLGSEVEAESTVRFEFGNRRSDEVTLIFTTRPILVNMQTELVFPAYTRLLPRSLEGVQQRLVGLPGTRMVLGFTFSKELAEASLVWEGEDAPPLRLETSGRYATIEYLHQTRRRANLQVRDKHGFELEFPVVIAFEVQEDEKPIVLLPRHLKDDMPLLEEPAKLFGFGVQASDDFGITRVVLKWQKSNVDAPTSIQDRGEVERVISPVQPKVIVSYDKLFEALAPKPGDKITFWVEGHDNRAPKPQMTASRRCSFFVFHDALSGLSINELGFGSAADMVRERIAKSTRATAVKAPEGLRTKEAVKNEFEAAITTGTQAPAVRGEHSQATIDYFKLFSTVKYPEEKTAKRKNEKMPKQGSR